MFSKNGTKETLKKIKMTRNHFGTLVTFVFSLAQQTHVNSIAVYNLWLVWDFSHIIGLNGGERRTRDTQDTERQMTAIKCGGHNFFPTFREPRLPSSTLNHMTRGSRDEGEMFLNCIIYNTNGWDARKSQFQSKYTADINGGPTT